MANIKIIKGSQLPVVEDITKSTFLAYEGNAIGLKSGRVDFSKMTPLFGVTGDKGQSETLAISQKTYTDTIGQIVVGDDKESTVSTSYLGSVNLNSSGTSTLADPLTAVYNAEPLKSKGVLTSMQIRTIKAGTLFILVLRPNTPAGYICQEISRKSVAVNSGITLINDLNIPVLKGDFIGLATADGTTTVAYVNGSAAFPYRAEATLPVKNINDKYYQTTAKNWPATLGFLYNFVVLETISASELELNPKLTGAFAKHGYNENIEPKTVRDIEDMIVDSSLFGQTGVYGNYITATKKVSGQASGYVTSINAAEHDGLIKSIKVQVQSAINCRFAIGTLDQNNNPIFERDFYIQLKAGVNTITVEEPVKKGQYLIYQWNSATFLYENTGSVNPFRYAGSLGSALNYFGSGLDQPGGTPFNYSIEYTGYNFVTRDEGKKIDNRISTLESKSTESIILKSPNGRSFQLIVDNNGNLATRAINTIKKWTALGNSITNHAIWSYWWGAWGMAASKREKDWVHLLNDKLSAKYGNVSQKNISIGQWEADPNTSWDVVAAVKSVLDGDEDMVVIRIGENVQSTSGYKANLLWLVDLVKSLVPNAMIIITGNFWTNESKDTIQKQVAEQTNSIWVRLAQLDTAENKSHIGAQVYGDDGQWHTVDNSGVANHPSDQGMKAIAECIFAAINF